MRKLVVVVLTVAVLFAYGALLKWAWQNGQWWVFAAGGVVTVWLTWWLSSPEERREGAQEIRRLIGLGRR